MTSLRERLEALYAARAQIDAEIVEVEREVSFEQQLIRLAREAGIARAKRRQALCGTDSGYYRHIRGGRNREKEPACEACKLAHKLAEMRRRSETT